MQSGIFSIQAQERIVFGTPSPEAVAAEAEYFDAKRVFVTSTRSLAVLSDGPLQRVEQALGSRHCGTFSTISAHSPLEDVIAAANTARSVKADLIVAIGGGSVIDASKVVQLCLWQTIDNVNDLRPYAAGNQWSQGSALNVPADAIRMVAVPTTLSAADFTSLAGITDKSAGTKLAFKHRSLVPRSVVLDPEATLNTPDWLLFSTGIRAVDHAVESYCCPQANLATETLSLRGLTLLSDSLRKLMAHPEDLQARMTAQFGMWHAIWPATSGIYHGASHGIGYALGAGFGIPHGHTSCVMLPAVLQWNAEVNGDRQKAVADAIGNSDIPAWKGIRELIASVGMPCTLRDVGITRGNLDEIAQRALEYQPVLLNPRPIKEQKDVMEILELCY